MVAGYKSELHNVPVFMSHKEKAGANLCNLQTFIRRGYACRTSGCASESNNRQYNWYRLRSCIICPRCLQCRLRLGQVVSN